MLANGKVGRASAGVAQVIFGPGMGFVAYGAIGQIRSGRSHVSVMEATNLRDRDHATFGWKLDSTGNWRVPTERQVCARLVVILEVPRQSPNQVRLVEHDHVIQTFAANGADHALRKRILPGRPRCGYNFLDAHVFDARAEILAIYAVPIANQKPRRI